jgi:hypothetical protein
MGFQNYAVITSIEKSYIKFNNNKKIVYKHMAFHKITESYTEWFSVCPNITLKFLTIVIFKGCVKENNN